MTHLFNPRVRQLIKENLKDYGKGLLVFLGTVIASIVVNLVLPDVFNQSTFEVFNFITVGFVVISMLGVGINAGCELPQHVRIGVARKEYFIATTTAAVIVSLLVGPFLIFFNVMGSLFIFGNLSVWQNSELLTLVVQFLVYLALFLFGFCVTVLFQSIGWISSTVVTIGFLIITNALVRSLISWFDLVTVVNDDNLIGFGWSISDGLYWSGIEWSNPNLVLSVVAIAVIVLFGISTYKLIKNMSIRLK